MFLMVTVTKNLDLEPGFTCRSLTLVLGKELRISAEDLILSTLENYSLHPGKYFTALTVEDLTSQVLTIHVEDLTLVLGQVEHLTMVSVKAPPHILFTDISLWNPLKISPVWTHHEL